MIVFASAGLLLTLSSQSDMPIGSAAPHSVPPDIATACAGDNPYLVTACHRPRTAGAQFEREPAVIAFNDTPGDRPHYLLATQGQVGAVYGLAHNWREPAVYAAAFHRRQTAFGTGGPGAIYRIDLSTGAVSLWVTVPDAGPDRHDRRVSGSDPGGMKWVGKTSLGDLDVSADGQELFVLNLNNRRIYRYAVATGVALGDFANGAAGETWSVDAYPFGIHSS